MDNGGSKNIIIPKWFGAFYDSLSEHKMFSQKNSAIVESSGKSREYISRLFKKATGNTFCSFLNKKRIEYAANMLTSTNQDIIDIAYDSGFDNLSTFYHLFKKEKGCSPKKYRDLNSKESYKYEK